MQHETKSKAFEKLLSVTLKVSKFFNIGKFFNEDNLL